eukprot:52082-Chlamydomonas_euryale.AAC.3
MAAATTARRRRRRRRRRRLGSPRRRRATAIPATATRPASAGALAPRRSTKLTSPSSCASSGRPAPTSRATATRPSSSSYPAWCVRSATEGFDRNALSRRARVWVELRVAVGDGRRGFPADGHEAVGMHVHARRATRMTVAPRPSQKKQLGNLALLRPSASTRLADHQGHADVAGFAQRCGAAARCAPARRACVGSGGIT